jgi:hypothetical protein
MKNLSVEQENKTGWYINHNPIDKYLQVDRIDYQTNSKFLNISPEENIFIKKACGYTSTE